VEIWMTNTLRAISMMIEYLGALTFHQAKISKYFIIASHIFNK